MDDERNFQEEQSAVFMNSSAALVCNSGWLDSVFVHEVEKEAKLSPRNCSATTGTWFPPSSALLGAGKQQSAPVMPKNKHRKSQLAQLPSKCWVFASATFQLEGRKNGGVV